MSESIAGNPKCKECKGKGEQVTQRGSIRVKRPCNCVPKHPVNITIVNNERALISLLALREILGEAKASYTETREIIEDRGHQEEDQEAYQAAIVGLALVETVRSSVHDQCSDNEKAAWESL